MSNLKFVETHNLVAFLEKPEESDGFEGIIDFLNASSIRYALTVNPTIYTSCIKQFWATAKEKTVNGEVQIQALVDGKKVIVTETSVRRALQLKDAEGTKCLPNATIFEQLTLMGGEDRLKLNELMELYTSLSQRVLALETTKTNQALEIDSLKRRIKKLEKKKKSRTYKLKRLFKVARSARSQRDGDTLYLIRSEVEVEKVVSTAEVTTASATTTTVDKLTLAQTLIETKAAKPMVVTTAATTTTTTVTRPKARGVVVQELSKFKTTTSSSQTSQLPRHLKHRQG
ncbi:hypothetical protein Tco_0388899 [Tanacetum coccineum]